MHYGLAHGSGDGLEEFRAWLAPMKPVTAPETKAGQ